MHAIQLGSTVAAGTLLFAALAGTAAFANPTQDCHKGLITAASKYRACQDKAALKYISGSSIVESTYEAGALRCVAKYAAVWPKLQAKAQGDGTFCDDSTRFDTGTGILIDHLTGLKWELKDSLDGVANPGNPHDADNTYSWTTLAVAADGTAYTSFLSSLNAAGFAGEHDWRLPTIEELATIQPVPCAGSPCIDPAFGPTFNGAYWTASGDFIGTVSPYAWYVDYTTGHFLAGMKTSFGHVRAVSTTR